MTTWTIDPATPFVELWARFATETKHEIAETTGELYETHATAHLAPFFATVGAITTASIATYSRRRLGSVKRDTLNKERSTLGRFLAWAEEQGYLDRAPEIPPLPRRAKGTPYKVRRRGKATELDVTEVRAAIDALLEWSRSRRVPRFPMRARFIVAFETSLRPSTLDGLSVPEHYTRGATVLVITDEIDKIRFGRELPLSDEARAALDSVCPEAGLIFGRHDYRDALKKAAKASGMAPHKIATFTAYDFRHARLTQLAETGNLTGASYLAGHKRMSTTAIYVRANRKAAARALAAAGATGYRGRSGSGSGSPPSGAAPGSAPAK